MKTLPKVSDWSGGASEVLIWYKMWGKCRRRLGSESISVTNVCEGRNCIYVVSEVLRDI